MQPPRAVRLPDDPIRLVLHPVHLQAITAPTLGREINFTRVFLDLGSDSAGPPHKRFHRRLRERIKISTADYP